jgi:hypothetical protein
MLVILLVIGCSGIRAVDIREAEGTARMLGMLWSVLHDSCQLFVLTNACGWMCAVSTSLMYHPRLVITMVQTG